MMRTTKSAEETQNFANEFSKKLKGGEILALTGDLGSGKTTFVQGLAKGFGIKEQITSPTFILLNLHQAKNNLKLAHFDLYRLDSSSDYESIGMSDYLGKKNIISVIEWAEKIKKELPDNNIWIKFKHINENKRKIIIHNS